MSLTSPSEALRASSARMVLSLFPGADLLGRGFEAEGFCVVRGPDLVWGGDVREFHPPSGKFDGIIGGSPCQDFSKIRRAPPSGNGVEMLAQFARCIAEASPEWFLLENVPGVPGVVVEGYRVQRFNLNARECGVRQNRLRAFQFGYRDSDPLIIARCVTAESAAPCCLATEGKSTMRRGWGDFCELQGLPRSFDLPGLSVAAKYCAVGNGVPVPMARVVATAIKARGVTNIPFGSKLCECECGRVVHAYQKCATASCRKRLQRRRDLTSLNTAAIVTSPAPGVTRPL